MKIIFAALVVAFTVGVASPSFAESNCEWAKGKLHDEVLSLIGFENNVDRKWEIVDSGGLSGKAATEAEEILTFWHNHRDRKREEVAEYATIKIAVCDNF